MTTEPISDNLDEVIEQIESLIEEEQYDAASDVAQKALEVHDDAALHTLFTEIAVEQERYEDAINHIAQLFENEEHEWDDEDRSNLLNVKAHAHFYAEDLDVARHTFNAALSADQENWTALLGRAMTHNRMGFFVACILDLDQAIAIDDQEPEPFALRGQVYLQRGDFGEAHRDLGYAIEIDPFDEASRLDYARITSLQGNTADAIETLELLVEEGENPDYLVPGALLRSQLSLTLGSAEAASEDAQVAIEHWPESPWGYLQLAACFITGMKGQDALDTLKKAEAFIGDARDIPDIYALRANALELLDRHDQAKREKKKAEGSPKLPFIVYGPILNPARNAPINPDNPIDIRAILGDLFGHPDQAPDGYEEALREVIDKIPSIIEDNPEVERIQIELPEVEGMEGGPRNLVIQVNRPEEETAGA